MTSPSFIASDVYEVTIPATGSLDLPSCVIKCKGAAGNVVVGIGQGVKRTYPIALEETLEVGINRLYSLADGTTATGLYIFTN